MSTSLTKKLFFCTNVFKWKIFSEGSKQFLTLYFNFEPFIACMYTKKRRKNSTKHTQKNQFKKCVEKMQTPGYNSVSTVFLTSQTSNSITKLTLLHTSSQLFAWKEDYFISWCPLTRYQHSTPTRGLNENLLFRTHWVTFIKVGLCNFGDAFAVQHWWCV